MTDAPSMSIREVIARARSDAETRQRLQLLGMNSSEVRELSRDDLRDAIAAACFDPRLAGYRGERSTDEWRADAVMVVLEDFGLIPSRAAVDD